MIESDLLQRDFASVPFGVLINESGSRIFVFYLSSIRWEIENDHTTTCEIKCRIVIKKYASKFRSDACTLSHLVLNRNLWTENLSNVQVQYRLSVVETLSGHFKAT